MHSADEGQNQDSRGAAKHPSSRLIGAEWHDFSHFQGDTEVQGSQDPADSPGMGWWWLCSKPGSLMVAWQWRVGGAGACSGGSRQRSVTRNSESSPSSGSSSSSRPRGCTPSSSWSPRSRDKERALGFVMLWAVQANSWCRPVTRATGKTVSWFGKAVQGGLEEGGLNGENQGWALRRGFGGEWGLLVHRDREDPVVASCVAKIQGAEKGSRAGRARVLDMGGLGVDWGRGSEV